MHNDANTMRKQQDYQKSDLCIMVTILVESIFIKMRSKSLVVFCFSGSVNRENKAQ